jgi:N-acetyl-beta-hexosaminidase
MKFKSLLSLLLVGAASMAAHAEVSVVNITPKPNAMTVGSGTLALPQSITIGVSGLTDEMTQEVTRFAQALQYATGIATTVSSDGTGFITIGADSQYPTEGYGLNVTATGVTVKAATAQGLFYAFQSIKKMLPANVMAEIPAAGSYSLPVVDITDQPVYGYRGFMLDCSRNFWTVDEIKRMLDVMSYYKMNAFHWHLTDDQGWRFESKKYPKLNTIAATAPNRRFTDMTSASAYWINQPYGPYIYTWEDMREIVAYAAERHIEVIPEVEFPGHCAAVMAAYPEFSCSPEGSHTVWSDGGISTDVLNIGNEKAVQFAMDILDEVMEVFPSTTIHIGGDECPSSAWESNAECKALYSQLGLSSYRALQSYFTKELSDHVAAAGRKLAVWNESVTASGSDLTRMQESGATVYSWNPVNEGVNTAVNLGLPAVYTAYGPYYINRKQSTSDPYPGAGTGSDTAESTYNHVPFSSVATSKQSLCLGVQGTFWCEWVSNREYLEYLALPRLIAVAEAGWTKRANMDFDDFVTRFNLDTQLLDLRGYNYGKHYVTATADNETPMPDSSKWYRMVTKATDARAGWCLELLTASSSKIGTGNAQANRLWSNTVAEEGADNYDNQFWQFRQDPANPGHYALVCKAKPNGSVNATPTADNNTGRWDYDDTAINYGFVINYVGDNTDGSHYYSFKPDASASNYLNLAGPGQNYSINLWSNPADGNGGLWTLSVEGGDDSSAATFPRFAELKQGATYSIANIVDGFVGETLSDEGTAVLGHSSDTWAANAWKVETVTVNADNSQTVTLSNAATGKFIGALGSYADRAGCSVSLGSTAAAITIHRFSDAEGFSVSIADKSLWPMPAVAEVHAGSNYDSSADAPRVMGAAWDVYPVTVYTYNCTDTQGNSLGTFTRSIKEGEEAGSSYPVIKNHEMKSITADGTTFNVVYERTAVSVTYDCRDQIGGIVARVEYVGKVGESYKLTAPEVEFYETSLAEEQTITLTEDITAAVSCTTEATSGVLALGDAVSSIEGGKSYVLYDNDPRGNGRCVYRYATTAGKIIGSSSIAEAGANYIWQIVNVGTAGTYKRVMNLAYGTYIPKVTSGSCGNLVEGTSNGGAFLFTYDESVSGWRIKNATDAYYWDGNTDGTLAGWTDGGQPYLIYEYFVQPYFTVNVVGVDLATGNELYSTSSLVKAGSDYSLSARAIDGMKVVKIEGNDGLDHVAANTTVTVTYVDVDSSISAVTVAADNERHDIYDLQGRRLRAITRPGIYIVGGHKVLIEN